MRLGPPPAEVPELGKIHGILEIRAAEGRLVPELLELSLKECSSELVGAALEEFFVWDVPQDYDQTDEFSQFFVPWFVYEFVDDPHDSDRVANAAHESLVALYLRRHGEELSSTERTFLESACTSPLSFYTLTRTVPGSEIAPCDILTGSEVVVGSAARRPRCKPVRCSSGAS